MESKLCSLCHPPCFSPNLGVFPVNHTANVKLPQTSKNRRGRGSLKLGFRSILRFVAYNSESVGDSSGSATTEREDEEEALGSVRPTYVPTPPNRELRTPHSGYHFDGTTRKFFEGWYFKVSIPERRQTFCFMYSVESPAFTKKLTPLEVAQYGARYTGVGAQILGADDKYICQYSEESQNFWGSRHELMLGNTFVAKQKLRPPNSEVPPQV